MSAAGVVDTALVRLWGELVGGVSWNEERQFASFEFDREFLARGLDVAPLTMPLAVARQGDGRFEFPALARQGFQGLPGLLADALPDRFGNALIDSWLARQGRTPVSFSPVERLCYTGRRAMGALEFEPPVRDGLQGSIPIEVAELVRLAQQVQDERAAAKGRLDAGDPDSLIDILRVGTSAGGARPKAVIALNDASGELRSGQLDAPSGFRHWILKFDGVRDTTLGDPRGFGRIEMAYSTMARAAGIAMSETRLLEENGRAHFMSLRFDRVGASGKIHMQSLCALAHLDYNDAGAHSYEQAFSVLRELRVPHEDIEEMYRRMIFNVLARNQDDHTKNLAFLMDRAGVWRLAPAFDLTYAFNPDGRWTHWHQMSIAGKSDDFGYSELIDCGHSMGVKRAAKIFEGTAAAVDRWPEFADETGVEAEQIAAIGVAHRRF